MSEKPACPRCGGALGFDSDEGECGRCGTLLVLHRTTREPVVVLDGEAVEPEDVRVVEAVESEDALPRHSVEPQDARPGRAPETTSAAAEEPQRSTYWPTVGVLVVVFIVVPMLLFAGCSGGVAMAGAVGTMGSSFIWIVLGCAVALCVILAIVLGCAIGAGLVYWLLNRFRSR